MIPVAKVRDIIVPRKAGILTISQIQRAQPGRSESWYNGDVSYNNAHEIKIEMALKVNPQNEDITIRLFMIT